MEWIIKPLNGFNIIDGGILNSCSGSFCQCRAGLIICTCSGGMVIEPLKK